MGELHNTCDGYIVVREFPSFRTIWPSRLGIDWFVKLTTLTKNRRMDVYHYYIHSAMLGRIDQPSEPVHESLAEANKPPGFRNPRGPKISADALRRTTEIAMVAYPPPHSPDRL